eukprot:1609652-Amphidinium_carterae.1
MQEDEAAAAHEVESVGSQDRFPLLHQQLLRPSYDLGPCCSFMPYLLMNAPARVRPLSKGHRTSPLKSVGIC